MFLCSLNFLLHLGPIFFHFPFELLLVLEVPLGLFLIFQLLLVFLQIFLDLSDLFLLILRILLNFKLGRSDLCYAKFLTRVFIIHHGLYVLILAGYYCLLQWFLDNPSLFRLLELFQSLVTFSLLTLLIDRPVPLFLSELRVDERTGCFRFFRLNAGCRSAHDQISLFGLVFELFLDKLRIFLVL